MIDIDLRRLAAVDMYGGRGTRRRRLVIIWEFVLGAVVGLVLGIVVIAISSDWLGLLIGLYAIGVALNYVPLAIHALSLRHPDALAAELRGVDIHAELRRYTTLQFWVFVPLLFVAVSLTRRGRR